MYRRGIESLDSVTRADDAAQCDDTNWVSHTRCEHKTRHICGNCHRRVCGTHAHNHKGDWRTGCGR